MFYIFIVFTSFLPGFLVLLPRLPVLDVNILNMMFLILVIVFIIKILINKNFIFKNSWIVILFIYTLVVIASVSWSVFFTYDNRTVKSLFTHAVIPFAIAMIAYNEFRYEIQQRQFIRSLFISEILFAIVAIFEVVSGTANYAGTRAGGSLGNANETAVFMAIMFPFLFLGITKNYVSKLTGMVSIFFTLAGIFCTVSRKGIIAICISSLIYLIFERKFKTIFACLLVVSIMFVVAMNVPLIAKRFEKKTLDHEISGRVGLVMIGLDIFQKDPLKGCGFNGYIEIMQKYNPFYTTVKLQPHNQYIQVLANYGIIGFIPYIMILILPIIVLLPLAFKGDGEVRAYISSSVSFCFCIYFMGGVNYALLCMFYSLTALALQRKHLHAV